MAEEARSSGMSEEEEEDKSLKTETKLTKAEKAKIERNRQKALLVRQSNAMKRALIPDRDVVPSKVIDTGGGFLIEEEEMVAASRPVVVHPPGALLDCDSLNCEECGKDFLESFLFDKFSKSVCDSCKDMDDKHRLITKTDAKEKYLLKDVDLDKREPILRFIVRKNPHNSKWGDMKLFLESRVAERALDVWESDEKLEEEREKRNKNTEKLKKKKFDKKMKELRMNVRGSLYKKATGGHQHEYGPEAYNESDDTYTKTCQTCSHVVTFEKM